MKHVLNYQQYERMSYSNYDSVNEGKIMDFVRGKWNLIKNAVNKQIQKAPGSVQAAKRDLSEYRGLSFKQIYQKISDKYNGKVRNEFGEEQVWHADETGKPTQYSVNKNVRTTRPYTGRPNAGEFGESAKYYKGNKLYELSEPLSDNHRRQAPTSSRQGLDVGEIVTNIFGIGAAASFITSVLSAVSANIWSGVEIFGEISGVSGLTALVALVIYILVGTITSDAV